MDSVEFCGQVCHSGCSRSSLRIDNQPHARVKCVECHVGPGASSFAKAKLAGTRRVLAVTGHNYSRPIVAGADNCCSARDTCEQCHWPEQFHGDKIRRIVEYANDEKNTDR